MKRFLFSTMATLVLWGLVGAAPGTCQEAEDRGRAHTQITAVQVTPAGDLQFTLHGEGFDPQLALKPLAQERYQITIASPEVEWRGPSEADLTAQLQSTVSAIESALLPQKKKGFSLQLISRNPLRPQILSNSPQQVVITLLGNHQRLSQAQPVTNPFPMADTPSPELRLYPKSTSAAPDFTEKAKSASNQPQLAISAKPLRLSSPPPLKNSPPTQSIASREPAAIKPLSRRASLSSATLETDWLKPASPPQPTGPSSLSALPTPDQPSALEPINLLSQRIDDPAKESPPPTALRLQKTPADYTIPIASNSLSPAPTLIFRALANEYDRFTDSALQRGAEALTSGRLDDAELTLRNILEREPQQAQAQYLLARTLLNPARFNPSISSGPPTPRSQEAHRLLKTVLSQTPSLPVYQALITLALDEQRLDEAGGLLKEAQSLFPQQAPLHYLQGRLLEGQKQWEEAQKAYQQALALDLSHPEYHYRLAQIYLKRENWAACARELSQALSIAPDDARYIKLMGYLSEKNNQPQAAADYYKAALQTDVMLYYGRWLQQQKRPAEALVFYQAVEMVADRDADLLLSLGTLYTQAKASGRAKVVLKKLLTLIQDPSDPRLKQAKILLEESRP